MTYFSLNSDKTWLVPFSPLRWILVSVIIMKGETFPQCTWTIQDFDDIWKETSIKNHKSIKKCAFIVNQTTKIVNDFMMDMNNFFFQILLWYFQISNVENIILLWKHKSLSHFNFYSRSFLKNKQLINNKISFMRQLVYIPNFVNFI